MYLSWKQSSFGLAWRLHVPDNINGSLRLAASQRLSRCSKNPPIKPPTNFGGQQGLLIAPEIYREFFKPLHLKMNNWVHSNTGWKTLYHTCGSVVELLDDFIEAEIDILNPVQISARGMDPATLKGDYGEKLVFWGGGIDTQRTLPFGTEEEVREEVRQLKAIWQPGGGFVFCPVHNIQANVPVRNIVGLFEEVLGHSITEKKGT